MIKNLPYSWKLVIASLLFSYILIALAGYAETLVQGPLNVPGDLDFMAPIPGRYTLYRECASINDDNNVLNEILVCVIHGNAHLSPLLPTTQYTGAMVHRLTDPKSGKSLFGVPFIDFEILWPGSYHLHVEFSTYVDSHPDIILGPKGLVTMAALISLVIQFVVLFILIRRSDFFTKKGRTVADSEIKSLEAAEHINFVLLPPDPRPSKISSVFVIPFMPDGRVVVKNTEQGPDISGGPVQADTSNYEQMALDKTNKEIAVALQALKPVRIIQSDYYGQESESLLYGIVFTAVVDSLDDMPANTPERLILEKEEFLARYSQPFEEQMEILIAEAYGLCFPESEPEPTPSEELSESNV